MEQSAQGKLFVISAPSGAGKTTLCNAAIKQFDNLAYSISHTTRAPRRGERDGKDYFFISEDEFTENIRNNNWAEWANVHGHFYGTHASFIKDNLSKGKDILLDIDVQGAEQIVKRFPKTITIFIMPPSFDVLRSRLEKRGTDSESVITKRLENAKTEIAKKNMYQHIIINDDLEKAIHELISILDEK
jgi:guanylate kinase